MRLKLTFASIFFSLSIFIGSAHAGGQEPADLYVVETVTTLLTNEGRLKNTYAYKSLALGTSLLKYGSLDPYGILGTLIQHNAPQLLYTAGRKFLPSQIRKQYERLVGFSFAALHAYDLITNPSRQGFGYGFGILGVWLTKQLPYFNYLDDSYQQEVKGLIYFCYREAGFYLNDTLDKGSMYAFLETLPFVMKEQAPAQLCEAEEEMLIPATPLLLTREDILEQKMRIDDGLSSKINPHPNCSFTYQWQVTQMFNGTIDHILRAHQEALKQGKNLGIIWGEKHNSCSCYLQERELFKLAHLLRIETLYLEVIPEDYDGIKRFIANRILSNFDSETRTHAYAGVGIKGAHALQVGLQLKPAEKPTKQIPWVVPSPEYLEALEDFIENDPILLLVKSFHHGDPIGNMGAILKFNRGMELTKCPHFSERDENMAATLNTENKSFLGIFGAAHLGGIHKELNNPNFLYVYISCFGQSPIVKEDKEFQHLRNLMGKVISNPSDCLKKLDDHLDNVTSFFQKSSRVYKSLTEDDREF